MSLEIVKHSLAKDDLAELAEFIRRRSPRTALRFLKAAERSLAHLATMPELGAVVEFSLPDELAGLRCWRIRGFKNHLVFYRFDETTLEVVRVLYGTRDIEALFGS